MSSRFEWGDMRIFLAVAEHGSITGAAAALNISQPTISQRLKALELQLNSVLLLRRKTGVGLTEAGKKLRDQAAPMLRAAQAIDRQVREHDDKPEGRVRISAPEGVLTYWIAPRMPAFQRAHPKIALSLDAGFWPNEPIQDEVYISLQYHREAFGECAVEPIATVHYGAFATRRYLETYGYPKNSSELVAHRTLHHAALQQQKETWDPKAEAVRTLSNHYAETNSSAALTMAVLADGGITYIPTFTASYFEGLVMVGEEPAASPLLYLVYDPRLTRVARVALVIEWFKSIFDSAVHPYFRDVFVHPNEFVLSANSGRLSLTPPLN